MQLAISGCWDFGVLDVNAPMAARRSMWSVIQRETCLEFSVTLVAEETILYAIDCMDTVVSCSWAFVMMLV